ncbi:MAG TPA: DNA gyrase inhibitor YacG [Tepidisphaeraceae bacterium]|jgi:hypothetical protein
MSRNSPDEPVAPPVCPICKRPVDPALPPGGGKSYLPFCSERCKLIDLGRWLGGRYQIPVVENDESDPSDGDGPTQRP